jgi:DNA-binding LytR/AlgR family response regulator
VIINDYNTGYLFGFHDAKTTRSNLRFYRNNTLFSRFKLQKKKVQFSYIIIEGTEYSEVLLEKLKPYDDFLCVGSCNTAEEGLNKILELRPTVVFLSVDAQDAQQKSACFSLVSELNEFLDELPFIIVLSTEKDLAYDAYQRGIGGFLLKPVEDHLLRKCLFRYAKNHKTTENDKICIRSHGDYHFITTKDIVYLKADSNTTDFYLTSGKIVTAYKTLKHFEKVLPFYFFRIHHSYIINIGHVSRINLGKNNCYLMNNEVVLSFSRTYKENIDIIINQIS